MRLIKINRALKQSAIGKHRASADAMLALIPDEAIAALTSKAIAAMLDAMWHACQASKAIACREAISEGAIWDENAGKLREIAR